MQVHVVYQTCIRSNLLASCCWSSFWDTNLTVLNLMYDRADLEWAERLLHCLHSLCGNMSTAASSSLAAAAERLIPYTAH